ncbi:siderophore-interacting protein [Vogesella sp. DC21W]|uniref:Siderophore-interacting protein n=1 Tax=Vogesella aquatica TaxID=2984206 RepID=A0ABT5ITF8_9NEIS|nr:siderophore-interacting protein [Vogesella aquatica]MDC7715855.1 siderophore-interacting protein [Vogesella aquatica]
MSRPTDRLYHFDTHVVRATQLTPRMRRITVSCPELAVFHVENGPNIKLYFPLPDGSRASRAYTVRHFRRDALELDIDFLLHEPDGAASLWARHAQPGDPLAVMGPRAPLDVAGERQVLLLADLCALPAASALLESLPADTCGHALLAVPAADEIIALQHPAGVNVQWVVADAVDALLPALDALPASQWQDAYLWAAAESGVVKAIRARFIAAGRASRARTRLVGYWKQGLAEHEYHDLRHVEMDEA